MIMIVSYLKVVFVISVFFVACNKTKPAQEEQIKVGLKSCAQKMVGGENISICLDSVLQDSRCPKNAVCIWEGMVIVKFSMTLNNQAHSFILSSNKRVSNYATDTTIQNYKISFLNLLPYPGDNNTTGTYAEMLLQHQ